MHESEYIDLVPVLEDASTAGHVRPGGPIRRVRRDSTLRRDSAWWASGFFVLVTLLPVIRRILHPTISGDDLIRLITLIEHSFQDVVFRPFNEHVAFLFDTVSWVTWQAIGHDLRLAPLGYSIASVIPWVLVLALLGCWLVRETGSRTSSLLAVAIVAQSPLVMETVWWYSASSFCWAIAAILLAILGASDIKERPRRSLVLIGLGTMLGPAGSSLGHLAAPLAILRALLDRGVSRGGKVLVLLAAFGGVLAYLGVCRLGGLEPVALGRHGNAHLADLRMGLEYALSVPGRLLLPSAIGLPASWCSTALPAWLGWGIGGLLLLGLGAIALQPGSEWNQRTVLMGAAMIYLGYALTYTARVCKVRQGVWSEAQLIYGYGTRYHVLPLLGLSAVFAALLAGWRPIRRCDARSGRPELVGTLLCLAMLAVHRREVNNRCAGMLYAPDQKPTMAALHNAGQVAQEAGISRSQLLRIVAPVLRPWNLGLLLENSPDFPLMKLVQAPEQVARTLTDEQARSVLLERLREKDRIALGTGACASMSFGKPGANVITLSIATPTKFDHVREYKPGQYRSGDVPGRLQYEFEPTAGARFLVLPGLKTDQELEIYFRDVQERWRSARFVRWLPPPRAGEQPVVDLERMIHLWGEPVTQIAIQFTRPGEIALEGPPRLMR